LKHYTIGKQIRKINITIVKRLVIIDMLGRQNKQRRFTL
jgi:hypothetical protein